MKRINRVFAGLLTTLLLAAMFIALSQPRTANAERPHWSPVIPEETCLTSE